MLHLAYFLSRIKLQISKRRHYLSINRDIATKIIYDDKLKKSYIQVILASFLGTVLLYLTEGYPITMQVII